MVSTRGGARTDPDHDYEPENGDNQYSTESTNQGYDQQTEITNSAGSSNETHHRHNPEFATLANGGSRFVKILQD
jgi:hypothetical protein